MLEEPLPAEVLEVRVLHPAITKSLVGKVISVLEDRQPRHQPRRQRRLARLVGVYRTKLLFQKTPVDRPRDRKSTRLNSSHTVISYAVFCLKKKKKKQKKIFI